MVGFKSLVQHPQQQHELSIITSMAGYLLGPADYLRVFKRF